MKIALVSPYDFAFPGGVTHHISSLYRYFQMAGHDVKIIAPCSRTVPDFGDRFIPIGKARPVPTSGSIARITISLTLSPKVKEVLAEEKFDVVHLHEPLIPMLCTTVLRHSDAINIGTFHASGAKPSYRWAKPFGGKMLLKRWYSRLDGKIAVSRPAMEFVNKHFPGDYTIIPNGIDLKHFSPEVQPFEELCDGKVNIVFVGRLEKRKGVKYLIGAYKQIKQQVPNSRLIIVGPGVLLRRQSENEVNDCGLKDVIFTGQVNYTDLPRYYKTADIFCAPATGQESFGIVLLEAMAIGKPVVASAIDGYASVLSHGQEGLLVPPKDENGLAEAILTLIHDPALRRRMGAQGIIKAAGYSWEHVSKRVLDFYTETMKNAH